MGLALLDAARIAGIPGVLDLDVAPDPDALRPLAQAASHVIASSAALRAHTGEEDPEACLRAFDGPGEVAITDGPAPVRLLEDGSVREIDPVPTEVVSTLGAGDVFHGAAAHALAAGGSFRSALAMGTEAAAFACAHGGGRVGAPTNEDLTRWRND